MDPLRIVGWNDTLVRDFGPTLKPGEAFARVGRASREVYLLHAAEGTFLAKVTGGLRWTSDEGAGLPVVGDWVTWLLTGGTASITAVLPRKTLFARKVAGRAMARQAIAANIDAVLLVMGLDRDFNLRRIERYLTLAWNSRAKPIVVLSKADRCKDVASRRAEVESVAPDVPVVPTSSVSPDGLEPLMPYLERGATVALLGSSGAGKSSIVNGLKGGDVQRVGETRAHDGRGMHTTTASEMFPLDCGAVIIDTPGLRELQLWSDAEGLDRAFDDIRSLAARCRFADCTHRSEPGCAIRAAVARGEIDADRLRSLAKLERELAHAAMRNDVTAQQADKRKWKQIRIRQRAMCRDRHRNGR